MAAGEKNRHAREAAIEREFPFTLRPGELPATNAFGLAPAQRAALLILLAGKPVAPIRGYWMPIGGTEIIADSTIQAMRRQGLILIRTKTNLRGTPAIARLSIIGNWYARTLYTARGIMAEAAE